MNLNLQNKTQ